MYVYYILWVQGRHSGLHISPYDLCSNILTYIQFYVFYFCSWFFFYSPVCLCVCVFFCRVSSPVCELENAFICPGDASPARCNGLVTVSEGRTDGMRVKTKMVNCKCVVKKDMRPTVLIWCFLSFQEQTKHLPLQKQIPFIQRKKNGEKNYRKNCLIVARRLWTGKANFRKEVNFM